jgi:toxin ParE1/3/4
VQLREHAAADIDQASQYYLDVAGADVALGFVDAVERAVSQISRSPHTGSLRFSYELGIPHLRAWPLDRFPYLVFYVAADDVVEVWRILHTRRDVPGAIGDEIGV